MLPIINLIDDTYYYYEIIYFAIKYSCKSWYTHIQGQAYTYTHRDKSGAHIHTQEASKRAHTYTQGQDRKKN